LGQLENLGSLSKYNFTQLLNQPYAGTLAPFTFARMKLHNLIHAVPAGKQRPRRVSSAHRYPDPGMIPPTSTAMDEIVKFIRANVKGASVPA